MKKKFEFDLIVGYFLFSFGVISVSYAIISVVFYLPFGNLGIVVYAKDILFDLVFILMGLLLIKKKKNRKFDHYQIK